MEEKPVIGKEMLGEVRDLFGDDVEVVNLRRKKRTAFPPRDGVRIYITVTL